MKRIVMFAFITAGVLGCSSPTAQIEAFVGQRLKDPESAKYSNIRWHNKPYYAIACGTVNAKNSFGAYEGPTDFIKYSGFGVRFERPGDPVSLGACCDVLLAFEPGEGRDVEKAPGFAKTCGRLDLLTTLQ